MSFLTGLFGASSSPSSAEEQKQDNAPKQLSKEELANKRLHGIESAILSPPQSKKQKLSENEEDDDKLLKMAMNLSMTDEEATITHTKSESFDYLLVMCILEIRHNDFSEFDEHILNIPHIFDEFVPKSKVFTFCVIENDSPISSSSIEAIFIDRFQRDFVADKCSFKYLLKSYERCLGFEKRINSYFTAIIPQSSQFEIVSQIKQCCLTFCGILLSTPDLSNMADFVLSQDEFFHILCSPAKGRDFPKGFLPKLFEQIEEDSIGDILERTMNFLKSATSNIKRSNFGQAMNAMIKLSQIECVALYLQSKANSFWIPNELNNTIGTIKHSKINGHTVVNESILGGLLNLSYECEDIQTLFSNLTSEQIANDRQSVQSVLSEYRLIVHELQNGVCSIFDNFVRIKNKECRQNIVRIISFFVFVNMDRGKMRFDHLKVSRDGFMLNLNFILLSLVEPIIKRNMMNKIDTNYFLIRKTQTYASFEDSTLLSCDANEYKQRQSELYGDNKQIVFGFTTEIFCLCLEALHLGFSAICNDLHRLQVHIARLRREARSNPMAAFMINLNINNLEKRLLAQIAHLMDQRFILMVGRFYGFFCNFLLYLSQSKKSKDLLSVIPEYYIEDMCRFFRVFLTERQFASCQLPFNRQSVIKCLIYLMSQQTPIRNIYQRACLCEVLLYFVPPKVLRKNAQWNKYEYESHEFMTFACCKEELVKTLLILYTDVERTGSPGQYYEKFKFRTKISMILKFLFCYKVHQNNLLKFWQNDKEKFISFLNMLINDLIYSLDHGFDGLTQIRQIEVEQSENSQSEQSEIENLGRMKDNVRHYMNLANESIELLQFVCKHEPKPFMDDLILPRIAVLISVYLDRLSNGSELRVRGNLREDYNFNAKFLLVTVVGIFNLLRINELFLDAIVEDEAHFNFQSYSKAISVLRKKKLMDENNIKQFEDALATLIKKFEKKKDFEIMLGDIPNKYLDPIMQTLMSDPVILGKNKNEKDKNQYVMDRKVIERHLMNNPNNPFNREPLTKSELIPHSELKKEIDEWVKRTLAKHNESNKEEKKEDE